MNKFYLIFLSLSRSSLMMISKVLETAWYFLLSLQSLCLFKNQTGTPFPTGSSMISRSFFSCSAVNSPALLVFKNTSNNPKKMKKEPYVWVNSCDFANHDCESTTNSSDFSQGKWKFSLSTDIGVVDTNNVSEIIWFLKNETLFPSKN